MGNITHLILMTSQSESTKGSWYVNQVVKSLIPEVLQNPGFKIVTHWNTGQADDYLASAMLIKDFGNELNEKTHDIILHNFSDAAGGKGTLIKIYKKEEKGEETKRREAEAERRAVEDLIADLRNNNRDVRFEAVKALRAMNDPRSIEPLIAILKDNIPPIGILKDYKDNIDEAIGGNVVATLEHFEDQRAITAVKDYKDARKKMYEELREAELKCREEEAKRRAEEEERIFQIQSRRKSVGQCVMCVQQLSLFKKLSRKDRHPYCTGFKE